MEQEQELEREARARSVTKESGSEGRCQEAGKAVSR